MKSYVIFDIDGTINDAAAYALPAYKRALGERNIPVTDADIYSIFGMKPEDIVSKFLGKVSKEEYQSWRKDIIEYEQTLMKERACDFPGIADALQALKDAGYQLAVCSNAYQEHIDSVLSALHLTQYFDVVSSLEMGGTKSDVLRALLKKCKPDRACMVGDRFYDIDAARENQIPSIGCLYGYAPEEARKASITVDQPLQIPEAVNTLFKKQQEDLL